MIDLLEQYAHAIYCEEWHQKRKEYELQYFWKRERLKLETILRKI